MIGLDTNVLVRQLGQDNPGQSRKATQLRDLRSLSENRLTRTRPSRGFCSNSRAGVFMMCIRI
jgi:predicted nucleic-acid-binding protein